MSYLFEIRRNLLCDIYPGDIVDYIIIPYLLPSIDENKNKYDEVMLEMNMYLRYDDYINEKISKSEYSCVYYRNYIRRRCNQLLSKMIKTCDNHNNEYIHIDCKRGLRIIFNDPEIGINRIFQYGDYTFVTQMAEVANEFIYYDYHHPERKLKVVYRELLDLLDNYYMDICKYAPRKMKKMFMKVKFPGYEDLYHYECYRYSTALLSVV